MASDSTTRQLCMCQSRSFSWKSLMGEGATVTKRFVYTVFKKSDMIHGTLDEIFRIYTWSMNALATGESPHYDHRGRKLDDGGRNLADGYCGVLAQCRGDWAFYCELFSFPQWNSAERMCWLCRASSTDRTCCFSDCGPHAEWRNTLWDHEGYIAFLLASGQVIPILFLVLGFCCLRLCGVGCGGCVLTMPL